MPTTFTSLVIFLILLTPGFIFLILIEQGRRASQKVSAFRETATVAIASIFFSLSTLGLFGIFRALAPGLTPNTGRIVRGDIRYLQSHYISISLWVCGLLLIACGLAVAWTALINATNAFSRLRQARYLSAIFPPHGTKSTSAWRILLIELHEESNRLVTCILKDGTTIEGLFYTCNQNVEENADRDMNLSAPFVITDPSGNITHLPKGAICVSAKDISYFHVRYLEPAD